MLGKTRKLCQSLKVTIAIACALVSALAKGAVEEVYFAGVAFTGSAQDASIVLPYSSVILADEGLSLASRKVSTALVSNPPESYAIIFNELANISRGTSSVVLAATLDRETVLIEKIGDEFKILIELAGQALFFDFQESQILFSYPITVQHIDLKYVDPTPDQIKEIISDILFGDDDQSFAGILSAKLKTISLPEIASRRLRVKSIAVSDEVIARHGRMVSTLFETGILGHEVSKILSDTLSIPLLPFSSGQAIGGAMPLRFANTNLFDLKIPDADYEIVLTVDDFRGRTLEQTNAFRQELIGSFFSIDVIEPLSGRSYFSQSLRQGSTKVIPVTQESFNAEAAYYETLILGLTEFSKSILGENTEWISQQSDSRQISRQLISLRELVDSSR